MISSRNGQKYESNLKVTPLIFIFYLQKKINFIHIKIWFIFVQVNDNIFSLHLYKISIRHICLYKLIYIGENSQRFVEGKKFEIIKI